MRRFRIGSIASPSRTGLLVAFAAVVACLALVDGLVLLAVMPQLRSLRAIADDHARTVGITTGIRAGISASRRALLDAVDARWSSHGTPDEAVDRLRALARGTDGLLPLASAAEERDDAAALRASLGRCAEAGARLSDLLRAGDAAAARRASERFLDLAREASEDADRIVTRNVGEVEALSTRIRVALAWTAAAATAIALLGGSAALLLLRRALRGLETEAAAARARSSDLEAFAARAAHELRTPLQTVSLALAALRDARGGGGALDVARRSTDRLRETVDGLLDFARAGVAAREPGAADLGRVLGEVREELAPHLASSHVAMDVDVPPGTTVAMATSHLATVMRNLVGNAAKYAGGPAGARVTIRATADRAAVHVEVADNGPGIAPDALPRVFEPFVRATSAANGHGLGLATVRRLVEAHHGAVRISSAPGHGTTVELDLPAQRPGAGASAGHAPGA